MGGHPEPLPSVSFPCIISGFKGKSIAFENDSLYLLVKISETALDKG